MMKLTSLLFLLLTGCATYKASPGYFAEDAKFNQYTILYKSYKKDYLGTDKTEYSIHLYFNDNLPSNIAGRCYKRKHSNVRVIRIARWYWNQINGDEKLTLFMHEMGHCDLDFKHQDQILGIMNHQLGIINLTDAHIKRFFLKGI